MTEFSASLAEGEWAWLSVERDLIERATRDRESFGELYRKHYDVIAAYIYRRLGDRHAAEDVVQDVFLSAMRSLGRYRYRGVPLKAWLYRIATNAVNRRLKRDGRRIYGSVQECIARHEEAASEHPDAIAAREALLSLAPRYQTVLTLHYLEGMSLEESAAVIGCRVGTVKSRLSRAREAMRKKLL